VGVEVLWALLALLLRLASLALEWPDALPAFLERVGKDPRREEEVLRLFLQASRAEIEGKEEC
jgi:hypothetical protein